MPDSPIAALAEIRERGYGNGAHGARAARLSDAAAVDVPRLLAALDAALKHHEPVAVWSGTGCTSCLDGYGARDDWPCDEYKAILTALTGKGENGDREADR